jgi:NTE family protein
MFQSFTTLFAGAAPGAAPPIEHRPHRPKIGLALGGGAARGWAHIGVLKRLAAQGIEPDIVVGTSVGAVAGGCWVAGKLDALEEFTRSLTTRRVLGLLDVTLGGSGLIGGRKLESLLARDLADMRVENLPRTFVTVATELGTGHEIWLKRGPLIEAMRASYALPGVFSPVRVGDRWLVDGALVNPVPVSVCRALGARIVIAVNLHADTFGRGATVFTPAEDEIGEPAASDLDERERPAEEMVRRKVVGRGPSAPGLSRVMMEAFQITQDRVARSRLAGDPPDVMICPRLARVGLFEFHKAADCIAAGEEAAERSLGDVSAAIQVLA